MISVVILPAAENRFHSPDPERDRPQIIDLRRRVPVLTLPRTPRGGDKNKIKSVR